MTGKKQRAIFYFLIVMVILISDISAIWLPGIQESESPPLLIFIPLFAYIIMIFLPISYKRYDRESFVWGHRFLKGALIGFILITMIFLVELASGLLHIEDIAPGTQNALIAGFILQGIVAFGEELPFRGYILPDMTKKYGTWNAVFLSSIFVSFLHLPSILTLTVDRSSILIMLLTITLAEILLAICYLYDGLLMSIGFHFTWNFFQYHVYSLREGFYGILKTTSESQLLTGGTLGPEAGLLGLFVMIIALLTVFLWMQSTE